MKTTKTSAIEELEAKGRAARAASHRMAYLSTEVKNRALHNIADSLISYKADILAANRIDYKEAGTTGMNAALLDRLMLNASRLEGMSNDVRAVAALPDPVGEVFDMRTLPNGLLIGKKRVPLGVIGAIYESRPNVTIDISVLCLKSGNAVFLRGGSETIHSNRALVKLVRKAITDAGLPEDAVQFVDNTDRSLVNHILKMNTIDMIVPRGGAALIKFVAENAAMPVITGGIGVCHTYVDKTADVKKAAAIVYNAKVQRPTVCNALDTIIVHADVAEKFLPLIAKEFVKAKVELHCDKRALAIVKPTGVRAIKAVDEDWGKEFLALVAAVKVVDSFDEALAHIEHYGSGHSEAIVTEDYTSGQRFLNEVDAACVYVNASTRFTDGSQFGLGAEVGISTQKMHARGPMGLTELSSYKWVIYGSGQVRP